MSNEWKMVRLGDVGNIVTGNTPKTSNITNYNSQDVCFYKPSDIGETVKFLTDSENKVSATALNEARELPISSVLVSCIGIIGKIGILTNKAISNQQINAIIPNEDYDSKFLAYSLLFNRPRLQSIANAPVVPIINKTTFSNFTLFVPSLERQREIAEVLDKASELVEKRKAQLAELDLLAESVFYDMFGDPVTNSKGWSHKTLSELGDWKSGGTPSRNNSGYFCGDTPWVSSGELNNMYIDVTNEHITEDAILNSNTKKIKVGSILLGMYDTAALKSSITKRIMCCNQAIAYSRLKDNVVDTLFVYTVIQICKDEYKKLQRGIRQKNLNLSMIKAISIIYPPLSLQQQFAERIEKIEEQKQKVKTALKESKNLFQRLMQDMFNPDYHNS